VHLLSTRLSITVSFALLTATAVHAQPARPAVTDVPRVVSVAGTFHPANGLAPAPVEIVTLSIYEEETGGAPLWRETQTVTIDAAGHYTLLLGSSEAQGLPTDLFASGSARWLGVQFERPGEHEQPRVQLASVPYALQASNADTLGGRPASAFVLRDPKAASPTGGHTSGGAKSASEGTSASLTVGTANFIGKFVNTTDLSNSILFDNGSSVGVNTTSPLDAFHVRFTDGSGSITGYAVQNLSSSASSFSGMLFYDQNSQLGQFQGFNNVTHEYRINNIATSGSINFMTGSTSRFLVANTGNIGIGATVPAQKLDVVGDITLSGNLRRNNNVVLRVDTTGLNNVSLGTSSPAALTGTGNVTVGNSAGQGLTSGTSNTALGTSALQANTGGTSNVAVGFSAMSNATTGTNNVYVGASAGAAKLTGDNNIYIGAGVGNSANADDNTTRVGLGSTRAFVAGIRGVTTGVGDAVGVVIDSAGQLGTVNSSRRYKEDIQDMGSASSGLMKLRPVTFRYKQAYADRSKPVEYGLIAEEVEEVYPDLVAHLADGEVETVQYHKINAMLLNEVQKQQREIEELKARLAALERSIAPQR